MKHVRLPFAVIAAALLVLSACADDTTPGGTGTTSPTTTTSLSPSPSSTTFEEPEWSITTPAGWTREDVTANADATKAIRYGGSDGRYVIVHIDPTGSDFNADAVWRYTVSGNRFEVAEKTPCTSGDQCSTSDTRFDGYLVGPSGTDTKVGGHSWYFAFGNTTTTTIDEAFFEGILESVQVKGA